MSENMYNYVNILKPSYIARRTNGLGTKYLEKPGADYIKTHLTKCMELIEPWFESEVAKVKLGESVSAFIDYQALQSYLCISARYRWIMKDVNKSLNDEIVDRRQLTNLLFDFAALYEPFIQVIDIFDNEGDTDNV